MPPDVLDRSAIPFMPGSYGNDIFPICTAVAAANCARAYSWLKAHTDIVVDPLKPRAFFATVENVPNTDAAVIATDGAIVQDVLEYAEAHGYDIGQQVPAVPLANAVYGLDQMHIADTAWVYGAANLGVALSVSDQNMPVWDTDAPANAGDPVPGSWGLHNLILWDWEGMDPTSIVRLGTWGAWQPATWRWVLARVEEAWALVWPQFDRVP